MKEVTKIEIEDNVEYEIVKNPHAKNALLFYKYFKTSPKFKYEVYDIHSSISNELNVIINKYYDLDIVYKSEYYAEKGYMEELIPGILCDSEVSLIKVDIKNKVVISIADDELVFISLNEVSEEIKKEIENVVDKGIDAKNKSSVHILTYSADNGMYLTDFKIDDKYNDLDLSINYNDDFEDFHTDLMSKLDSNDVGLYMLHGEPGTGKTTYIRHLIRKIPKRVIFVSPSMADRFSDPEMIPFLMKYPDSVIIIEDAENVIQSRKGGGNQSVSNLLNLSDGILGDCLKFQIICTFNTPKSSIDDALLRKGRLLKSYEFNKLEVEKTNSLLKTLGHKEIDKELVLSDIYNHEPNNFENNKIIGF